jgi:hypothetical protein
VVVMGGEESNEREVGILDQMDCLVKGMLEKAIVHNIHKEIDKMGRILVLFFPHFLFYYVLLFLILLL